MSSTTSTKTLILIRHAQSEENVKVIDLCDGIERIRRGILPPWRTVKNTLSLLQLAVESPVSPLGRRQILDMRMILNDTTFWQRIKPDIVVCSPLSRARDTCEGVLPTDRTGVTVKVLDDLEEATPYEHVFSKTLMLRIDRFKRWLRTCDEETIVVVGHSQYFKKMLGQKTLMRNCDVWQVQLDINVDGRNGELGYDWSDLRLLHRTELADVHPYDKLQANLRGHGTESKDSTSGDGGSSSSSSRARRSDGTAGADDDDDDVVNDLNDDPMCRICQMTQSEMPKMRLIKPCRCTGTQQHVHLICLNRWRETSHSAHYACAVCHYTYKVRRTFIADWLMSEVGAIAVSIGFCVGTVVVTGMAVRAFSLRVCEVDLARWVFRQLEIYPWWRRCRLDYSQIDPMLNHLLGNHEAANIARSMTALGSGGDTGASVAASVWESLGRWGVTMSLIWQVLRPTQLCYLLLCNDSANQLIDVVLLGVLVVGGTGFGSYLYGEVMTAVRQGALRGGGMDNPGIQRLVMLGMWIASLGNQALTRMGMVVGCCIAGREVYAYALVKGRALAQSLGEHILEYASSEEPPAGPL